MPGPVAAAAVAVVAAAVSCCCQNINISIFFLFFLFVVVLVIDRSRSLFGIYFIVEHLTFVLVPRSFGTSSSSTFTCLVPRFFFFFHDRRGWSGEGRGRKPTDYVLCGTNR